MHTMTAAVGWTDAMAGERESSGWHRYYTSAVASGGISLGVFALFYLPHDRWPLALLAGLAALVELGGASLLGWRRDDTLPSSLLAVAGILLFGPVAGGLILLTGGAARIAAGALPRRQDVPKRELWWWRGELYRVAVPVLAALTAGRAYVLMGGMPGRVGLSSNLIPFLGLASIYALVHMAIPVGALSPGRSGLDLLTCWCDLWPAVPVRLTSGAVLGGALALASQTLAQTGRLLFVLGPLALGCVMVSSRMNVVGEQLPQESVVTNSKDE